MALRKYILKRDPKVVCYCFDDEVDKKLGEKWEKRFVRLPPNPTIIHAMFDYMTEDPVLDSLGSIYELDRQLNIDAENDRELREMEQARINF